MAVKKRETFPREVTVYDDTNNNAATNFVVKPFDKICDSFPNIKIVEFLEEFKLTLFVLL